MLITSWVTFIFSIPIIYVPSPFIHDIALVAAILFSMIALGLLTIPQKSKALSKLLGGIILIIGLTIYSSIGAFTIVAPSIAHRLAASAPYEIEGTVVGITSGGRRNLDGCKHELEVSGFEGSINGKVCVTFPQVTDAEIGDKLMIYGEESWFGRTITHFSPLTNLGIPLQQQEMPSGFEKWGATLILLVMLLIALVWISVKSWVDRYTS